MALPEVERRQLALWHVRAQVQVRDRAQVAAQALWQTMPGYSGAEVGRWLSGILPTVHAAQMAACQLADAYLARCLEREPVGVDVDLARAGIRQGAQPRDVYMRPLFTVWGAEKMGVTELEAVAVAERQVRRLVATDVQLAKRAAFVEIGGARG